MHGAYDVHFDDWSGTTDCVFSHCRSQILGGQHPWGWDFNLRISGAADWHSLRQQGNNTKNTSVIIQPLTFQYSAIFLHGVLQR